MSGEGPEYIQKQFFRYKSNDNITTARPQIPEGMAAAQGKYIMLRYSIAMLEAEYGDSPASADQNLYLPDLRRMAEILLGSRPRGQTRASSRESTDGRAEGNITRMLTSPILKLGDTPTHDNSAWLGRKLSRKVRAYRRARSVQWRFCADEGYRPSSSNPNLLPDRYPEERMERHLPLTILNLPAVGPRLEKGQRKAFPQVRLSIHAELPRLPGSPEFGQPTAPVKSGLASTKSGAGEPSVTGTLALTTHDVNPVPPTPPSLCLRTAVPGPTPAAPVHEEESTGSLERAPEQPPPVTGLAAPSTSASVPDVPDAAAVNSSPPMPSQQPITTTSRSLAPCGPNQPASISGLLAGRKASESFEQAMKLRPDQALGSSVSSRRPGGSGEGGRSVFMPSNKQVGASAASRQPDGAVAEGIKLSTSSVVRDSASGVVTSKLLEAPQSPAEPPLIGMATSFALMNVSASRTMPAALPDIPEPAAASMRSSSHE